MMAAMERQAACEQAAQEKDPRFKEAERLSELRNKAQDRGDDAAADKYGEQFAALNDAGSQFGSSKTMYLNASSAVATGRRAEAMAHAVSDPGTRAGRTCCPVFGSSTGA